MVATDKKISALTELTAMATGDYLVAVDDPAGTPASKYITYDNLFQGVTIAVGIGRVPTADLDVYEDSGVCSVIIESANNGAQLYLKPDTSAAAADKDSIIGFYANTDLEWVMGNDADDSDKFKIGTTTLGSGDVVYVTQGGRLGLNVTPDYSVHVKDTGNAAVAYLDSDNSDAAVIMDAHTATDAYAQVKEANTVKYTLGHDATDGSFKITNGATPSAGTELFEINTSGHVISHDDFYVEGDGAYVTDQTAERQRFRLYGNGTGTNDYGIGMDASDLVVFFGAGGGCSFKTNDFDGTEIASIYTSSSISTVKVEADANIAEVFLSRTGTGAQDWKVRCGQTGGNLSFIAASTTVASLGNDGSFSAKGNITVGTDGTGVFVSSDGSSGVSGSFTTTDGKTVTVKDGIITSIV